MSRNMLDYVSLRPVPVAASFRCKTKISISRQQQRCEMMTHKNVYSPSDRSRRLYHAVGVAISLFEDYCLKGNH